MEQNDFPKRKELRLKNYDYSAKGAYFVTICVKERKRILSKLTKPQVGVGAFDDPRCGMANKYLCLTEIGKTVEKNLLSSENISGVRIDRYVIMPDHIHTIIFLEPNEYSKPQDGSSRAPTPTNEMIPHVVSTFKRFCKRELGDNIFQRGYVEHIIRDKEDYDARVKYICENPARWYYDNI